MTVIHSNFKMMALKMDSLWITKKETQKTEMKVEQSKYGLRNDEEKHPLKL